MDFDIKPWALSLHSCCCYASNSYNLFPSRTGSALLQQPPYPGESIGRHHGNLRFLNELLMPCPVVMEPLQRPQSCYLAGQAYVLSGASSSTPSKFGARALPYMAEEPITPTCWPPRQYLAVMRQILLKAFTVRGAQSTSTFHHG